MTSLLQSCKGYYNFIAAREFWSKNLDDGRFEYETNRFEILGGLLISPLFKNADNILKHSRDPFMIAALTTAAIGMATLVFYPEECASFVLTAFPFLSVIKPWMVKFGVYVGTELTIFGVGLRTFGRFSNTELYHAWKEKKIVPIPIGSIIEKR